MKRDKLFRGVVVSQNIVLELAQADKGVEFKGVTYMPTSTLAYFTFIMCHSLPTFNSQNFGMTAKTMEASYSSAVNQLLNIRHILAANDAKGRLTEDRIVGHIVDTHLPTAEWQEKGMLSADLTPTDKMTAGMPLYALGCLHKRAKGINRIIAEHKSDGDLWAASIEILFPWANAEFMVDGKVIAAMDAPDDLFDGVQDSWRNGTLPQYRYNGHPVFLIGGRDGAEIDIVGCALTTCPADSGADIILMAASLDSLGSDKDTKPPLGELPDAAFLYVEATGKVDKINGTVPGKARHCPIRKLDGSIDLQRLQDALVVYAQAEAVTNTISTLELRRKLTKDLLPLAREHFPDSDFIKEHGITQAKGGENMDLLEMLQGVKASLEELSQTDGFQSFKEASGKVNAAKTALFSVMDKCGDMVNSMAEDKAKALAEETVKENYVAKADHDKALADVKAGLDKAVEDAKAEWTKAQADKDAKVEVTAERIEKFRKAKVEEIPGSLKDAIEVMSADEEGNKAFDELFGKLTARRKACEEAKVVLSEAVDGHIVLTLADEDETFNATLELWKSLSKGTVKASGDDKKKPWIPAQSTGDAKEMIGVV